MVYRKIIVTTAQVTREELITITSKEVPLERLLLLRRVTYQDEKNRTYVFLSNNMDITAEEIALIYRKRVGASNCYSRK